MERGGGIGELKISTVIIVLYSIFSTSLFVFFLKHVVYWITKNIHVNTKQRE